MNPNYPIGVSSSGTILLGNTISCDGFHVDSPVRVQTHVHQDHMQEFESSKGFQTIVLTQPTMSLLINDLDADLPYRQNIKIVEPSHAIALYDNEVTLLNSGHMLGSVQVGVVLKEGTRVGYSGDFAWPLEEVIQVEALVVGSTYGNPDCRRNYSQGEVEEKFLELVLKHMKVGPVHIKGHRGTLQRALQILAGNIAYPIVGSSRFCREVGIYRGFAYGIEEVLEIGTVDAGKVINDGMYIRIYGIGDQKPVQVPTGTMITLGGYMSYRDDPISFYSERSFGVALSNHADFEGTLEYVKATGARFVVTDNTRTYGIDLAREIRARLGIDARPSQAEKTYAWGQ